MDSQSTFSRIATLEQRFRGRLIPIFLLCAVFQAVGSCAVVKWADREFRYFLFRDTGAEIANAIVVESDRSGQSVEESFRIIAHEFLDSYPGAFLSLTDESGNIRESIPPGMSTSELEGGTSHPLRGGRNPLVLHFGFPPTLVDGKEVASNLRLLGVVLSVYLWAVSLLVIALVLRWMGRAILSVAASDESASSRPRALSHELDVLREAVRDTTSEVMASTAALARVESQRRLLVARVIHDLRTPFTALSGYVELAARVPDDRLIEGRSRLNERYLPNCRLALQRIRLLLSGMSDYVRLDSAEVAFRPRSFSLQRIVSDALESLTALAAAKGIQLEFTEVERPESALEVWGDPELIGRVVVNLLDNAVKYTRTGGRVAVTLGPADDGLRLSISDSGIGISAADLAELGKEFFRSRESLPDDPGGTGLGLSNVREFLELHRSRLEITSELGVGSDFSFRLPRHAPPDHEPVLDKKDSKGTFGAPLSRESRILTFLFLGMLSSLFYLGKDQVTLREIDAAALAIVCFAISLLCEAMHRRWASSLFLFLATLGLMWNIELSVARDGEIRLLVCFLYLFACVSAALLLRTWKAACCFLLPLFVSLIYFDLQHKGGTSGLVAAAGGLFHAAVFLGAETDRSRRLALRSGFGFFAVLFAVSSPAGYFLNYGFERAHRDWGASRADHVAERLQGASQLAQRFGRDDEFVLEKLFFFPEVETEDSKGRGSPAERLLQVSLPSQQKLSIVAPSERVKLLSNRVMQGKLTWGVFGTGVVFILVCVFLGREVHRLISRRLQRLEAASRQSKPEVEIARFLAAEHCHDEITELALKLQRLYASLASERASLESATIRRRELLRRMAQRLQALTESNSQRLELLEASSEGSADFRPAAQALWDGVKRQTTAIEAILDFSRPVVAGGPGEPIDRALLLDLVMEIASVAGAGRLELDDRFREGIALHVPQAQLQTILFHALSLIKHGNGPATFSLLPAEAWELEIQFTRKQESAREQQSGEQVTKIGEGNDEHLLQELADDLHRETLSEALLGIGGRLLSGSAALTSFRLRNGSQLPTP